MFQSKRCNDSGSLWSEVAAPFISFQTLRGSLETDVVVIGAGYTGLSSALHLLQTGTEVIILEAGEPGFGASGRNNGQVIPTLSKPDPEEIEAHYGEAGSRFVQLIAHCADDLFQLVRQEKIAAEAEQTGWVQPVHSPGRVTIAERRARQWGERGAAVELLSSEQVQQMTGSSAWYGGFWNRTGGHVNPLALVRGLAHRVVELGAQLFTDSPALSYTYNDGYWHVQTPEGSVRAKALILATSTYTGELAQTLAPDIARAVIPVYSWQMATRALSTEEQQSVLPSRVAMSDTHRELYFARLDARHRLITGGALALPWRRKQRLPAYIGQRLQRLWPSVRSWSFSHVWNGYVGMTPDFFPRFHEIGPNAYTWIGCNGRAVALSLAIGKEFAKAVSGVAKSQLALPFTPVQPLPQQPILRRLAPWMLLRYRQLDRQEIRR